MTQKTFAFVMYPGLTILDLVGPLQVMSTYAALDPSVRVAVVGADRQTAGTDTPLQIAPSHTFEEVPDPTWVLVPGGGVPTLRALGDPVLVDYLRQAAVTADLMTSVCTGSLLLGQAGLLDGREATTHWSFLETLRAFGATPVRQRWADTGPVITAAGVSAGIDLALHLVERLAGPEVARVVQFGVEYDPQPPQGPLDWAHAPRERMRPVTEAMVREGLAGQPDLRDELLPLL